MVSRATYDAPTHDAATKPFPSQYYTGIILSIYQKKTLCYEIDIKGNFEYFQNLFEQGRSRKFTTKDIHSEKSVHKIPN